MSPTTADPPNRVTIDVPEALDPAAIRRIAGAGVVPELGPDLLRSLQDRRAEMLVELADVDGPPVYGVNTGMGALSHHRLDQQAQSRHQEALMTARSAGGPPWLTRVETRAVLAVRLRTFLTGDAGVSAGLCLRLAELLALDLLPALPRSSTGVAGEIIGLAHLGAALVGTGQLLTDDDVPRAVPAGPVLAAAGLEPLRLGPKEGVALIEGVPMTTALAILTAGTARTRLRQALLLVAAEFAVTGAARDGFDPRLARGDATLGAITAELRRMGGSQQQPRALQPPVSFRASAQVLAHAERTLDRLDAAIERALSAVSDSPAFLADALGANAFVGTAGFFGYDLASHLQTLTVALIGVAEIAVARLHRLLDPSVTGLNAQLSADPGPQTGISPVHKRAAGVTHRLRRQAFPATVGPIEASGGQEDVQTFSLEAADSCLEALSALVQVLACELLAVHQARCLGATLPDDAGADLRAALDAVAGVLATTAEDRPYGLDIEILRELLVTDRI